MKKVTSIFQLLVALFFAIALVFFLAFDSVKNGFGIEELTAGKVVVWLTVGFLLFLVTWMFQSMYANSLVKKIKKMETESNGLKAKLYDLEQGGKIAKPKVLAPDSEEEKDSSAIKPRQNIK
ncbi:hypothetical protein IFO69_13930 [Echinicola sp. CAU 1574]|uniref:Lipopolysaccharide assembly protein A domain-containing protein n=1 Tax=Echinicola arenosa TaxID=2774144 RepID=A0ABR9AM22_9BACT|nr:hypothetical protein [Echinicola arenosa]MBD8489853.1 hypothetical protein [Echinicola arenosa]